LAEGANLVPITDSLSSDSRRRWLYSTAESPGLALADKLDADQLEEKEEPGTLFRGDRWGKGKEE
jgi:hypothetical protein